MESELLPARLELQLLQNCDDAFQNFSLWRSVFSVFILYDWINLLCLLTLTIKLREIEAIRFYRNHFLSWRLSDSAKCCRQGIKNILRVTVTFPFFTVKLLFFTLDNCRQYISYSTFLWIYLDLEIVGIILGTVHVYGFVWTHERLFDVMLQGPFTANIGTCRYCTGRRQTVDRTRVSVLFVSSTVFKASWVYIYIMLSLSEQELNGPHIYLPPCVLHFISVTIFQNTHLELFAFTIL